MLLSTMQKDIFSDSMEAISLPFCFSSLLSKTRIFNEPPSSTSQLKKRMQLAA